MFLRILKGCSWQKFYSSPHVLQYFNIPLGPFSYATTFYPPSALLVYILLHIHLTLLVYYNFVLLLHCLLYALFQPQHLPYHVYYSFLSSHSLHAVQFFVTSTAWSFNLLPFGMWLSTLCWTPSVLEAFIAKVSEVEVSFVRASQACKPSSVRGSRYLMEGCVPSWPYLVRQWKELDGFLQLPLFNCSLHDEFVVYLPDKGRYRERWPAYIHMQETALWTSSDNNVTEVSLITGAY